jgi:AcrR family transcriptional regulator
VQASPLAISSRNRRREATRRALLDAGAAEFARFGFDGARVSRIARAAGVANATFYVHFRDRADLFDALLTRALDEVSARLARVRADATDAHALAHAEVETVVEFAEANRALLQAAIVRGDGATPGAGMMEMVALRREQELRSRIADGVLPDAIDPAVAARAETAMMVHGIGWWLRSTRPVTRAALVDTLCALRRGALAPAVTVRPTRRAVRAARR